MTADELNNVERSVTAEQHLRLFQPHILNAYKYQALPLASRIGVREFTGSQYIRRNYTGLRWDKRITIENVHNIDKYTECSIKVLKEVYYNTYCSHSFQFTTRPSSEHQPWEWELKVHPQGYSNSNEDFKFACNIPITKATTLQGAALVQRSPRPDKTSRVPLPNRRRQENRAICCGQKNVYQDKVRLIMR